MKIISALVFVGIVAAARGEEEEEGLMEEGMRHLRTCAEKIPDVDFSKCMTLFNDDADFKDPAYQPCKCVGACVTEQFNILKAAGAWDFDKAKEQSLRIENEEYKEEANKAMTECKDSPAATPEAENCETFSKMFVCALEHAPKGKKLVKDIIASMG